MRVAHNCSGLDQELTRYFGGYMAERRFGHIDGVLVGSAFPNRSALAAARIHRPLMKGISGGEKEGADSIVLSGGYEDDEDEGNQIIYTGEGGRDPKTGKQIADQTLTGGNLALAVSQIHGLPVRVTRGAGHSPLIRLNQDNAMMGFSE
jgi:putative restriction endonuclease